MFPIPKSFISEINEFFVEVAKLNENNIFNACYILEYNNKDIFFEDFIPIFKEPFGFEKFLNQFQFSINNNTLQINNKYGKPVGIIYNLILIKEYKNKISNNSNQNIITNNTNNGINSQTQNDLSIFNQNSSFKNINSNLIIQNNISSQNNFNINSNLPQKDNSINQSNQLISQTPDNTKKILSIIIDFPSPPLIGLQNVGATCYMNATLQCLSQIKKLTDYFKYTKKII